MTIGDRIRTARLKKGITQRELGKRCGIAEPTIRKYESGKLNPKRETLQKLAVALDMHWLMLIGEQHLESPLESEIDLKKLDGDWIPLPDMDTLYILAGIEPPQESGDADEDTGYILTNYLLSRPGLRKLLLTAQHYTDKEIEKVIKIFEAIREED